MECHETLPFDPSRRGPFAYGRARVRARGRGFRDRGFRQPDGRIGRGGAFARRVATGGRLRSGSRAGARERRLRSGERLFFQRGRLVGQQPVHLRPPARSRGRSRCAARSLDANARAGDPHRVRNAVHRGSAARSGRYAGRAGGPARLRALYRRPGDPGEAGRRAGCRPVRGYRPYGRPVDRPPMAPRPHGRDRRRRQRRNPVG